MITKYRGVLRDPQRSNTRPRLYGSAHKASVDDVRCILELRDAGFNCRQIADITGVVKRSQVWNICTGHVKGPKVA